MVKHCRRTPGHRVRVPVPAARSRGVAVRSIRVGSPVRRRWPERLMRSQPINQVSQTYRVMTAVAYYAGLRPSEVVMIRRGSLDLTTSGWGRLHVTEADFSFDEPGEPKTGPRVVPIPARARPDARQMGCRTRHCRRRAADVPHENRITPKRVELGSLMAPRTRIGPPTSAACLRLPARRSDHVAARRRSTR